MKFNTLLITMLIVLGAARLASAQKLSTEEINDLSYQASQYFRQANDLIRTSPSEAYNLYNQVILRYQRIIEEGGVANGYLYYNVGNAYLLKGDIGKAILSYRQGQRLMPDNTDLAKNLSYARSQRLDQVSLKAEKRVLQTLFFWHYDLSMQTKFFLTSCFWAAGCIFGSLWLCLRRGRFALWIIGITLTTGLLSTGSMMIDRYNANAHRQGVITVDAVVARQGDGENYPASFTEPLHSGTEFDLLEERREWLRIELSSGDDAWVPVDSAGII
ncbi:MAG: hypothetical protein GY869_17440 [Planctomycetes bacterium]|nr:hypothetical protein [Planctomycetota bacterium]